MPPACPKTGAASGQLAVELERNVKGQEQILAQDIPKSAALPGQARHPFRPLLQLHLHGIHALHTQSVHHREGERGPLTGRARQPEYPRSFCPESQTEIAIARTGSVTS
jgi:hypothetical protein